MFKYIIIVILVCFVNDCSCACPNTFENALVNIQKGNYVKNNYRLNNCLHNRNITQFTLISPTTTILKGTFFNLPSLDRISLNNAGVYVIEPKFAEDLPKLNSITAARNHLEIIENNVFNNLPIRWLWLVSNKIFYIADGAFHGMNLGILNLNDNRLSRINSTWFQDTDMYALLLAYNEITSLHTLTFNGITGLVTLILEFNKIHYIAHDTFSMQHKLKFLYLSGNSLMRVGFKIPKKLNYMDVSFNLISSMSLENTTPLRNVSIYPNPWACQCLRRFWKETEKLGINISETSALKRPLGESDPLCIAADYITCGADSPVTNDALFEEYFNLINYDNLGKFAYTPYHTF